MEFCHWELQNSYFDVDTIECWYSFDYLIMSQIDTKNLTDF